MERGQSTEVKVWVNGTFDVLHVGHMKLLEYAHSLGTVRVGIDYDNRVKELKGDTRPINTWVDRIYFMSRIIGVDSVVGFGSEFELKEQIRLWSPDILVVGSDYKEKYVIGSEYAKEVRFFEKLDGYSTTNIVNR
jgi:D-beta-D-heptose 7-phosphate kinase/D-beta-D-heptose 1-phosphate adenosyltransferase